MNRDDKVIMAIRDKSIDSIASLFFDNNLLKVNVDYSTETELWDYKEFPLDKKSSSLEWAELAKDVLSFYNTGKGGIIFWGIKDGAPFEVVGIPKTDLDSKIINDKIRTYIGDKIWVEYFVVFNRNQTIGIGAILVPPSEGKVIQLFIKNGPEKRHRLLFFENGSAIRRNDSCYILAPKEASSLRIERSNVVFSEYEIDEPQYRLLSRDYNEFLVRTEYCEKIMKGLNYSRAAVVSLTGIGGVGKTALATWAVREAYKNQKYTYIVSITAKDRELTASGIQSLPQSLTVLDDLLNAIAEVMGFPELKNVDQVSKEKELRSLLENENALLFVDNLETTSDNGIIDFLNDLPDGVKAIVTSRRSVIKVSVYPIEVGPLTETETISYVNSLLAISRYSYCSGLSQVEIERIGAACNGIPLAIKWMISRCKTMSELISQTELMANTSTNSSELLEFSFRRIFAEMSNVEQNIMQVLSLIDNPPIEAIIHALKEEEGKVLDALDTLVQDTIVYSIFDQELKTYRYSILTLTRNYLLSNCINSSVERLYKTRLTEWYEASDITDESERIIVREMRQGNKNIGNTLIAFARNASRRGDFDTSKRILESAMLRDPRNWSVYKELAEYCRHIERSDKRAIHYYGLALKYALDERMNSQIAVVHREYGILYSNSGQIDQTDVAIMHLSKALAEMPHDGISAKFLSLMFLRKGYTDKVIETVKPFEHDADRKTLENLLPILETAYSKNKSKYLLEHAKLKSRMESMGIPLMTEQKR